MKLVALSSVLVGGLVAAQGGKPFGGSGAPGTAAGSGGQGPPRTTVSPSSNTGRPNSNRPSSSRPSSSDRPQHDGSGDMMDDEDMDDDMDKPFWPVHVKMPKCHGEDVIITETNVRETCERAYTESDVPMFSPHYPMWVVGHCFSLPARIEMGVAKKNKTLGPDFDHFKEDVQDSWLNATEADGEEFMNGLNQDHDNMKYLTQMCLQGCGEADKMEDCVKTCIEEEMDDDMEDEMEMGSGGEKKEFRNIAGMTVLRCFHKQLVQDMRRSRVRDTCEWMKHMKDDYEKPGKDCQKPDGSDNKGDKEFEFSFNFNGMPFEMTGGDSASSGNGQCGRLSEQVGQMQDKMDGMKEMIMGALSGNCGEDSTKPSTGRPKSPNGSNSGSDTGSKTMPGTGSETPATRPSTPEEPETSKTPEELETRPSTPEKPETAKPSSPVQPLDFKFDIREKEHVMMVRGDKDFKTQWMKCFSGVTVTAAQKKWKFDVAKFQADAAKKNFNIKNMNNSDKAVVKKVRDCFKKQKNSKLPAVKAVAVWFNTLKV